MKRRHWAAILALNVALCCRGATPAEKPPSGSAVSSLRLPTPAKVVLVVDVSKGIAGAEKWVKEDVRALLDRLKPNDSVALVLQVQRKADLVKLEEATTEKKDELLAQITLAMKNAGPVDDSGGSGIAQAMQAKPDVIVFFAGTGLRAGPDGAAEFVSRRNKGKSRLNVLSYAPKGQSSDDGLAAIAKATGGDISWPGDKRRSAIATTRPAKLSRTVIFVGSSGGSMMIPFDAERYAIRRELAKLTETQKFNLMFYGEDTFIQLFKAPEPAPSANRQKVDRYVDMQAPHGSTGLWEGVDAALKQQPEELVLFTDGNAADPKKVLAKVNSIVTGKKIKFSVVAFGNEENLKPMLKSLEEAAKATGGSFQKVE